jgi:hypothetical protein
VTVPPLTWRKPFNGPRLGISSGAALAMPRPRFRPTSRPGPSAMEADFATPLVGNGSRPG